MNRIHQATQARIVQDQHEWEHLTSVLGGNVLQGWLWGEFKQAHGWEALRLVVENAAGPLAAAQVLFRRYGPISIAYVPRGPLLTTERELVLSDLTLALDVECRRRRAAAIFVEPEQPLFGNPASGGLAMQPSRVLLQPKRTIKVPIDLDDETLLARMKPKTRYNVRLAERRGVTIRQGDRSDLQTFYQMLRETGERDQFGIHTFEYYADMLDMFGENAVLLLAEFEQQAAAGVIVVRHGAEAVYMYGASTTNHQRHMPAYLIQFAAMRWARDAGCSVYDLWGIPESDTPPDDAQSAGGGLNVRSGMWGVFRFKSGFGGEIVEYPGVFERVYMPSVLRLGRLLKSDLL